MYDIIEIIKDLEAQIFASMKRNLARHEADEIKEGFKWEQWQKAKLRNLKAFRLENEKLVKSKEKQIEELTKNTIVQEYKKGQSLFNKVWTKIKNFFKGPEDLSKNTLLDPEPKEESFFHVNDKKIEILQEQLTKDLSKAEHAIYRRADDIYKQILYKTQIQYNLGGVSLNQAIDQATKDFLKNGIDCIEYSNGRRVNIATYVEMALRTASHRAKLLGDGKRRDELGIYTVVVSAHANTCPKCAIWQGKVLIDDVFTSLSYEQAVKLSKETGYPLLSFAIEKGLLHPNCRHTITTFINEDITPLPKAPNEEEAIKTYGAQQKQRMLEVQIRKYKRLEQGLIDETSIKEAKTKRLYYQKQLREHLKEYPQLRREYDREKVRVPLETPKLSLYEEGQSTRGFIQSNKELPKEFKFGKEKQENLVKTYVEIDKAYKKDNKEHLMLLDAKTGEPLAQMADGIKNNVTFTDEMKEILYKAEDNSITTVHNHPSKSTFSIADILLHNDIEPLKESIVINSDGGIYYFSIPKGARINLDTLELRNQFKKSVEEYREKLKEEFTNLSNNEINHKTWQEIAGKWGWLYGYEKY